MKSIVTINGKVEEKISVFDRGFLYADGIYDTFRVFNGKAFMLADHIDRLFYSAKEVYLKIPYTKKELKELIKITYKKSNFKDCFFRIIVTRGNGEEGFNSNSRSNVIIICYERKFNPLKKIKVITSHEYPRKFNYKVKSLNYTENVLAYIKAKKNGFDDAIFINQLGEITEGTTSNIFFVKKGKIFTPSLKSGILQGTLRQMIMDNFDVKQGDFTIKDILSSEEVFFTGTANFVTSVYKINNKSFNSFKISKIIYNKVRDLVKNGEDLNETSEKIKKTR